MTLTAEEREIRRVAAIILDDDESPLLPVEYALAMDDDAFVALFGGHKGDVEELLNAVDWRNFRSTA